MRRDIGGLRHERPRTDALLPPDTELLVSLVHGHGARRASRAQRPPRVYAPRLERMVRRLQARRRGVRAHGDLVRQSGLGRYHTAFLSRTLGSCSARSALLRARGALRSCTEAARANADAPRRAGSCQLAADERRQGGVLRRSLRAAADRWSRALPAAGMRARYRGTNRGVAHALSLILLGRSQVIVSIS